MQDRIERPLLAFCVAALLAGAVISSRWPLVGDSVLMHYVVWLTRHGFAPYRQIAEMNLPMSYLSEEAAMRAFGAGNGGWRLYDNALLVSVVLLCWRLLRERGATAGVFAATLFAAVHLQDGVHMAGQRDLLVTVLEAAAGLSLLQTFSDQMLGARAAVWSALAGALGVAAACIKPPAVLFVATAVAWRVWKARQRTGRAAPPIALGASLGAALPLLLCLAYLWHFGAVAAFAADVHGLIAYHASLERRSPGFLLAHASSPVLVFLLVTFAALLIARQRRPWLPVDTLAALGAGAGLVSYLVQGKGFPYQRYALLLWLLLLCCSRTWALWRQLDGQGTVRQIASVVPVATGLVLIAVFLVRSTHFSDVDPYTALRNDLRTQDAAALEGKVQCLDTAGPCIGALYKERLTQSTGFLYDCYLLDGSNPVVQQQRDLFQREWEVRPPELLVLTDSRCFTGPRGFDKYTGWLWMQQQLSGFEVVLERHPSQPLRLWSRPERPYAYRILRRR